MKRKMIFEVADKLLQSNRCEQWHCAHLSPSVEKLTEVVGLISEVIFPEYLIECSDDMVHLHVVNNLDRIHSLLHDQVLRAMCIKGEEDAKSATEEIIMTFMESLAEIKDLLTTDVEAIYKADPAATSYAEIVLCYPSVVAMTHHRIAHKLHLLGVPIIPRVISELSHLKCGIDIHPGAQIDSHFAIDHGTGVVIGETTIIGKNVVIYQGVTLGAKGFRFDENGNALNIPRHPIIEDNVRIYSNSSILGRITIGHDSIIGGNMWVDADVAPGTTMVKRN